MINEVTFDTDVVVSVFETNIRVLGYVILLLSSLICFSIYGTLLVDHVLIMHIEVFCNKPIDLMHF